MTGLASTPLDQTASNAGSGSSPSSSTATTTQANELLVGAISDDNQSASDAGFSPGSGYTALAGVGTAGPSLFGEYSIVAATGTYAASGTFSTNIHQHWVAVLATYKAAPVQPVAHDTPFQVRYATNLQLGDARIYLTNTGANATTLCANVYGFTPDEQLVACCSCLVTPNGLASLSAWRDLLSDVPPVLPRPNALVLKLVATPGPTASSCDAGVVGDTAHPIVPGLAAWGTSAEPSGFFSSPPFIMATPFTPSTLSAAELASLDAQCHSLHSTPHLCPSCAGPSPLP